MGSVILAVILGGIGTIFIGLVGTWLKAELSACFEPFVGWVIRKGVERFPEEVRASVHAEILDINAAKVSPTLRLLDACSFYASAGRSVRAIQEAGSTPCHSSREFRRSMYLALPWSLLVAAGGAIQNVHDMYALFALGWTYPGFAIVLMISLMGEIFGGFIMWRHFRALRRVRRFMRASR
jgi:hypothetical protein